MRYIIIAAIFSYMGFMLKLPKIFVGFDKELHFAFYFFASAFLSVVLFKRSSFSYLFAICVLFMFGVFIEATQEISNDIIGRKIHGNFDREDIKYNFFGVITYIFFWLHYKLLNKIGTWKIIQIG
jgi:hypothetical protein